MHFYDDRSIRSVLECFWDVDRESGSERGSNVSAVDIVLTVHFSYLQYCLMRDMCDDARQPSQKQTGKRTHRDQRDEKLSTNTPLIGSGLIILLFVT